MMRCKDFVALILAAMASGLAAVIALGEALAVSVPDLLPHECITAPSIIIGVVLVAAVMLVESRGPYDPSGRALRVFSDGWGNGSCGHRADAPLCRTPGPSPQRGGVAVMYLVCEAYRYVSSPQARVGGPCHRARACHHAVSRPRGHDGLARGGACHRPAPVGEGRVTGPCHHAGGRGTACHPCQRVTACSGRGGGT